MLETCLDRIYNLLGQDDFEFISLLYGIYDKKYPRITSNDNDVAKNDSNGRIEFRHALSGREVAKILGTSIGQVTLRKKRILRILKISLDEFHNMGE